MSERDRMEQKLVTAIIATVYKDKNYKKILSTVPGVKSVTPAKMSYADLISLSMGDKVWELPELFGTKFSPLRADQYIDPSTAWGTPIYFCELHRARLDTKKYTLTLGHGQLWLRERGDGTGGKHGFSNTFAYVIELENQWRESYPDPALNQLGLFNE
jgi:hypothetical protein